jgi:hypothetical protein
MCQTQCNTTWDEQQKMDALRKIYNRAVQIPLDNVEKLWHELEAFETGLNRITVHIIRLSLHRYVRNSLTIAG